MKNVLLTIEYDGTDFSGWGRQPGRRTVQGTIEDSLRRISGGKARLYAASRTDAGVHAKGQVANFMTATRIPIAKLPRVMSALLPQDVTVTKAVPVSPRFSARGRAKAKLYAYTVAYGGHVPVALRRYVWEVPFALDVPSMRKAARQLVGDRDFSSFANTDKRRKLTDTRRRMFSVKLRAGRLDEFFGLLGKGSKARAVRIEVLGRSFLYKMVRGIVGTLVDVGRGRIAPEKMGTIISSAKRSAAGVTAPGRGLVLLRVYF